jgi:hypothetical protein
LLPASCWFFDWLIVRPWRWMRHVPLKLRLTFNGLYSIISQKVKFFITTAVWTSTHASLNRWRRPWNSPKAISLSHSCGCSGWYKVVSLSCSFFDVGRSKTSAGVKSDEWVGEWSL